MIADRFHGARCGIALSLGALLLGMVVMLLPANAAAASKIKVVTSTQDLASLAQEVGGDHVEVSFIGRGYQVDGPVEVRMLGEECLACGVGAGKRTLVVQRAPPIDAAITNCRFVRG